MGKQSTKYTLTRIMKTISDKPKTITEIARQSNVNRTSISHYVKQFTELKIIQITTINKTKKYSRITDSAKWYKIKKEKLNQDIEDILIEYLDILSGKQTMLLKQIKQE